VLFFYPGRGTDYWFPLISFVIKISLGMSEVVV